MSRGALFTTPLKFDLGASWSQGHCAPQISVTDSTQQENHGNMLLRII